MEQCLGLQIDLLLILTFVSPLVVTEFTSIFKKMDSFTDNMFTDSIGLFQVRL